MHYITFHCRTISPMFIGGAYSEEAELRPPSVKGALRFWARAIAKHWVWVGKDEKHQQLLEEDEKLFGGVKMNPGKSLVSVEVRHDSLRPITGHTLSNKGIGLKYLLFTLAVHNQEKEGIEAGFPFRITLRSKDTKALHKAIAAFWILTYFGALGTRARRGAGAFEVTEYEGLELPKGISFHPGNYQWAFLKDGIQAVSELFKVPKETPSPKGYSTLGQKIWVSQNPHKTWESALEEIGKLMYDFRQPRRPNQNSSERPRFTQQTLNQKAAFGLPISVRNERENIVNFKESNNKEDTSYDRRSSPLLVTLIRGNSGIHWLVSMLEGDFMENQSSLFFRNIKGRSFSWPKEDDTALKEFLQIIGKHASPVFSK